MAIITVTTAADVVDAGDGVLSLREAVAQANATVALDAIVFAPALEGQTLVLTGGELVLSQDVAIDGDQNGDGVQVTLEGSEDPESHSYSRHLTAVGDGTDVGLRDLTFTGGGGDSPTGVSAISALGGANLAIDNCGFTDNHTRFGGGAILATDGGDLAIANSSFTGNSSSYNGGAIAGYNGTSVVIRNSELSGNFTDRSGGALAIYGNLILEDSIVSGNEAGRYRLGGGIAVYEGSALVLRSTITSNVGGNGGGIGTDRSHLTILDSTIANNSATGYFYAIGGGLWAYSGSVVLRNSTITGNKAESFGDDRGRAGGGGVARSNASTLFDFANTIVAGNGVVGAVTEAPDVYGALNLTNGRNVFGSDVLGNNPGDRESVAASSIFAALDPETGGGLVNSSGIVPLRNSTASPALSGADPLAASATGQLGGTGRPLPAGSLPDIGSIEINQPLSTGATANNDVRAGTSAANTLSGLAGNDFLKGLGGNDTLSGGDGSDLLDGGPGNDRLNGDGAVDLVFYGGSAGVTVDLSLATDTARRGGETDTLTNVEGAIGSSAGDVFKGNQYNNYFQGGLGKDTSTGGGGRDLYDLNAVAESGSGSASRDVVTDFLAGTDDLDLAGVDADTGVAGNQAFRWVGTAALTGAGQLGFFASGGNTIVRASNDADAASELEVQLTGIKALTVGDFYL